MLKSLGNESRLNKVSAYEIKSIPKNHFETAQVQSKNGQVMTMQSIDFHSTVNLSRFYLIEKACLHKSRV